MQRELERVRDIAESWFSLSDEARAKHRAEFNGSNPQSKNQKLKPEFEVKNQRPKIEN